MLERRRRSLRVKILLVFLVFSITPLVITGITNYVTTNRFLEEKTSSLSEQAIDKLALYLSGEMQTLLDMTTYYSKDYKIASLIGASPKTDEEKETLNVALKNNIIYGNSIIKKLNWIVNYIVLTKEGTAYTPYSYISQGAGDERINNIKQEEWFDLLNTSYSGQTWLGSRQDYMTSTPSRNIYVASNIVYQFENKGVFLTYISGQYLSRILDNSRLSERSSLYLVDDKGNLIAEGNENGYPFEKLAASLPEFNSLQETDPYKLKLDSHPYIAIDKNLIFNGYDSTWRLLSLSPLEEIERDTKYAGDLIIALAAGLLIASVLLGYLINKMIVARVIRLNALMNEVKKGNFDLVAEETTRDEIGQLGNGFNKMLDNLKRYIAGIKREEEEKRKLEVKMLQEQIKPHFVRNTLNTIRLMAQLRGATGISQAVTSFSKMLDYNFRDNDMMTTVREEIGYLEEYIYLQELRYQNIFTSRIDIEPDIMELKILKLSFQPIVENSIMHGFVETQGQGQLRIKGYGQPGKVVFEITDDGVGIDPDKLELILSGKYAESGNRKYGGIGMANVDKRIKMNFGGEYGISITSAKGVGTTVTMTFPLIS